MADKEKEAYYRGRSDSNRYNESQRSDPIGLGHTLSELVNPTYSPPSGREEAYKAGWKDADRERKK